jgi:hypothetical protein
MFSQYRRGGQVKNRRGGKKRNRDKVKYAIDSIENILKHLRSSRT